MGTRGLPPVRGDAPAAELRRLAVREVDRATARRMTAAASAPEGMTRAGAARLAGTERRAPRDSVARCGAGVSEAAPATGARHASARHEPGVSRSRAG